MFHTPAIRTAQSARLRIAAISASARLYTTTTPPPPADQPSSNPKSQSSSNTLLYITGAAAAAGAYYYYSTRPDDVDALKKKAKADGEEIHRKTHELGSAGKARADDAYKQAQVNYDEAKTSGQDKLASIRAGVNSTVDNTEARARQVGADAQTKYDSYKSSVHGSLSKVRDSNENLYDQARGSVQKKGEPAKAGWFNWLGWGSAKAEEEKREGAGKVADTAEDVRKKASKRT